MARSGQSVDRKITADQGTERCESGRIGLTANELTWVTGSEGSNPSLSAVGARRDRAKEPRGGRRVVGLGHGPRGLARAAAIPHPGTPVDCPGGRAVLDRDVGLPEEPGRLGQAGRDPDRRRLRGGRLPRGGRPGGGQHLRLHRGRPAGVDRHRPGPGRVPPGGRPAGGHRVHGRALRRRTGRRPARGGPGGAVRGLADRSAPDPPGPAARARRCPRPRSPPHRAARPGVRPVEPAPAAGHGPVVLHQGGRGMRPELRVLRHPLVPGQAAIAYRRLDPGRGRPAGRTGPDPRRGGPGGPGPLVLRPRPFRRPDRAPPRTARPSGASRPIVDLVAAVSERVRWTRLLYLYPSTLDDALVEAILATGVPYFDLSLQHVSRPLLKRMRRWGEGDRFLDRIALDPARPSPTAAFRSSFIVGYPGRDRGRPRPPARSGSTRPSWTGWASSRSATRSAPTPPTSTARFPPSWWPSGCDECTELQDAITAARREALIGATVEVLVDSPGEGPHLPRGPRDRRDRDRARGAAGGHLRGRGGHRGRRARPGGRLGADPRPVRRPPPPALSGPVR